MSYPFVHRVVAVPRRPHPERPDKRGVSTQRVLGGIKCEIVGGYPVCDFVFLWHLLRDVERTENIGVCVGVGGLPTRDRYGQHVHLAKTGLPHDRNHFDGDGGVLFFHSDLHHRRRLHRPRCHP